MSEGAGRQVGLVTQLLVREVGVWRSSPAGAFRPHEDWHEDREALLAKLLAVAMNLAVERALFLSIRSRQFSSDLTVCPQALRTSSCLSGRLRSSRTWWTARSSRMCRPSCASEPW